MPLIKACIFDLDGVITNTAKYHFLAWKKLANELNINFTSQDNEKLKGVSRMASLEIILKLGGVTLDKAEKLLLADKKNKWYLEYISKITSNEILPGVKKFLKLLKNHGYKTALGSASKNSMIILNKLDLVDYFDAIIDGTKVTKAKPDPEIFLKGAQELGVKSKECVVFEDAEAGIKAAKNANMFAVGVGSKEILKDADLVIGGFNDISLDIFNSLNY